MNKSLVRTGHTKKERKKERKGKITQQDAKYQSEVGIILTRFQAHPIRLSIWQIIKLQQANTVAIFCDFLHICFQRGSKENYWLKDRQYTYNIIFRFVHETIVRVEKQYVLHNLSVWL